MNVMHIDDDQDLNFLMGLLFKKSSNVNDYVLENDPQHALEILQSHDAAPDCIFVDLNMMPMNGFEFVQAFESDLKEKCPHTRIYMLSSSLRRQDREKALEHASVKDFLVKPLTLEKLQEIQTQIGAQAQS
jgi:CheY-like chemotaxis protein